MSIDNALPNLQTIITNNLTGLKDVFLHPVEGINEGPVAMLDFVEGEGELATAGDLTNDEVTFSIVILYPRTNLQRASQIVRPYVTLLRNLIWANASLNGACETIRSWRVEGPGFIPYNETMYYGLRFEFVAHFKETVTFAL